MRLFRPFLLCLIAVFALLALAGTAVEAAAATITVDSNGNTASVAR